MSFNTKEYYTKNRVKIRAYQKQYHKTHPRIQTKEEHRNNNLKYWYKITLVEYNQMLVKQNNKCAGCLTDKAELKQALAVDHDHKTGKIRGLLCTKCNRALGFCNDNPNTLLKLIEYLKGANHNGN
jgi:hypothetical protein